MACTSSLLSEEHFRCSICMDVLTDPVATPCGHNYCKACITHCWDTSDVCKCPLCAKIFDDRPEVHVNYFVSEMVQQFRSHKLKEEYEAKTEAEIQQMIQERRLKIHEVKRSVELSRKYADAVILKTALITCKRSQAEHIDMVKEDQKTTEKQAEGFTEDLQQEITHLEKRISELKQLSHTGWRPTKDWTKINVHRSSHVGTLTAVSQEKTLSPEMKKLKLLYLQQYEVDVTLDPDTANPYLILSDDGKQVCTGDSPETLPDNTERFSVKLSVLGKQSFSSGRFYYEVQVTGKLQWTLGVARESINRKNFRKSPNNGFWTIALYGKEYMALTDSDVRLPVREKVQKVGVFVDYEKGLVSFYDVETRVHLHSFTGCTFTEKLFPFFSPGEQSGRMNSAPLIISPVSHID